MRNHYYIVSNLIYNNLDWNNLLSGVLGAFFLYCIQSISKFIKEQKAKKRTKKNILLFLNMIIIPSLKKLILEYEKVTQIIQEKVFEGKGGKLYVNNFNELSSVYLSQDRFKNYIENTNNQELHIMYLNLIFLLDEFNNKRPLNFILKIKDSHFLKLSDREREFYLKEIFYEIEININYASLSLDRARRLINNLEKHNSTFFPILSVRAGSLTEDPAS